MLAETLEEFDKLYLEKCQEVNTLEQSVENFKRMAETAIKQKLEIRNQLEECQKTISDMSNRLDTQKELLEEARQTIRELTAEPLKGFTPDVEPPEELPEILIEELPLWALQPVTPQDILCLSSALKNLYDIKKCDGWLLYRKLSEVLEQKIKEYSGED